MYSALRDIKFLGDEDKKGLYAWNGFGKVAPAAEG